MQPIDLSKLLAKQQLTDKPIDSTNKDTAQLSSASIEKQRLAIGILLKQTLQNLSDTGLLSIDQQKAILSAKKILPSEFTQLYIQDRIQQNKLATLLATQMASSALKPQTLSQSTVNQWVSGQMVASIVYQGTKNGIASLLLNTQNNAQAFTQELIKNAPMVQIKTSLDLQAGQQLLLQVNKQVMGSNSNKDSHQGIISNSFISFDLKSPPKVSNQISQHLNQLLSKQQAMPQLLASLQAIASQSKQVNSFFSPQFKTQVESLIQQFPPLQQLSTSQAVKSSLQNSGLYLESKIMNSPSNSSSNSPIAKTDLKAMLSQLVLLIKNNEALISPNAKTNENSLLKQLNYEALSKIIEHKNSAFNLPANISHAQVQKVDLNANLLQLNNQFFIQTRVLEQLEGVLSRIVIGQFQSKESSDQSLLNFEIPFRHNDRQEILQLKIRESYKDQEAEQGNKIWTVNLAFNLQSMGGIRIYITLDKKDLAMQFWTEEKNSQALFQQYFYLLSERLLNAGYSLSQLAAFHGMPEEAEKELKNSLFIIDEQV